MGDHEIDTLAPDWNLNHGREDQLKPVADSLLAGALGGRAEHGPRQVDADDVPAEADQWDRVTRSAAPDIERAHPPAPPPSLAFGEPQQDGVRRRLREPGDHLRRTPSRAGRRNHGTSGANHREQHLEPDTR